MFTGDLADLGLLMWFGSFARVCLTKAIFAGDLADLGLLCGLDHLLGLVSLKQCLLET